MGTALILATAGKRKGGRWERGSVDKRESSVSAWMKALDHAPDLGVRSRKGVKDHPKIGCRNSRTSVMVPS